MREKTKVSERIKTQKEKNNSNNTFSPLRKSLENTSESLTKSRVSKKAFRLKECTE
jgi:hypothetical protein